MSILPKSFCIGYVLQRHIKRVHEGLKNTEVFACDICEKVFTEPNMTENFSLKALAGLLDVVSYS